MTDEKTEEEPWHEAALDVAYRWDQFANAKTVAAQAEAVIKLSNAVFALKTWLPGWDYETGTMPWDREEE